MDPFTMTILAAAAQAAIAKGLQEATPEYGMTNPQAGPAPTFDFNSILAQAQQGQSQLPQMQLQNRLPRY